MVEGHQSLGVPVDRAGRVIVGEDLAIPGHPEVLVVGDLAAATSAETGKPVPGVAQGAIQMGRYAGHTIDREVRGHGSPRSGGRLRIATKARWRSSEKAKAVTQSGRFECGFLAWLLWGGLHVAFLFGFRNRVQVVLSWFWNWLLDARDARLITGDAEPVSERNCLFG